MTHPVEVVEFPNGFKLVYQRSLAAPVLALDLWVVAGSADERADEAGIAHVVEHMMFKGTRKRGPGELAREVENLGGEVNAFTSFDHTVYTLTVAGRYAREGIDLLYDALTGSVFDADELEREKLVILEEVKRSRDIPQQYLARKLFATAYRRHPYKNPVIGTEESVSSFKREDLKRFTGRWYRPSNMALVAVGNLETAEMVRLVEETFATVAAKPSPRKAKRPREPRPAGFAAMIEGRAVGDVYFDLAFPAPHAGHRDVAALDLLSTVLGHGESSRLNERIKLDANLVHAISAGVYVPADPGLFYVGGVAGTDKFEQAYEAVCRELFTLTSATVGGAELTRAKETVEADFVFQRETAQGRAQKLGYCHVVLNDPEHEERYLADLGLIDADDLKAAARRYLSPDKAVMCMLHPKEGKPPVSAKKLQSIMQNAQKPPERRPGASGMRGGKTGYDAVRFELPNGATVMVQRNGATPIGALRAALPGGSRLNPTGRPGVFHALGECLVRGTAKRSVIELAREADRTGGHIEGFSGRNSFGVRSEFLSKNLEQALDLVCDVLTAPLLDAGELDKVRADTLAAIKRRDDNPAAKAFRAFERLIFGKHPYGHDVLGTLESMEQLGADELKTLYRAHTRPERLSIALAGDVDPAEVERILGEKLNFSSATGGKSAKVPAVRELSGTRVEHLDSPFEQAHVVLGFLGSSIYSEDRLALKIVNAMLSGQGGRLFTRLRDEMALAYAVTSATMEGIDRGYIAGYIATSPERAEEAREGLLAEMTRMGAGRLDSAEVEKAKRRIAGSYEISLQENSFRSGQMALDSAYGLDWLEHEKHAKKVLAVSRAAVERAARKYLDPDNWVAVVVAPEGGK